MTWVDWVIVVFVGLGVVQGLRLGFLAEGLAIAAYVVAWVVASRYSASVATALANRLGVAGWFHAPAAAASGLTITPVQPILTRATDDAAFVLLFLLVRAAVGMVARAAARLPLGLASGPNRLLGGALGGVRNLVILLVVWSVAAPYLVPGKGPASLPIHASLLLPLLAQIMGRLPVVGGAGLVGGGVS